jgi:hypothetical protein
MELLLLHLEELDAGRIFDDEGVADAQGLTVHLEDALALIVLDPLVVPYREELLAHPVLRASVIASSA